MTPGEARRAREGRNCPVCGRFKRPGALWCTECAARTTQHARNLSMCSLAEYACCIADMKDQVAAEQLGMRLIL